MLLGNILAELLAVLYLWLHFNWSFDQLEACGTWEYNSVPPLFPAPQVGVCRMDFFNIKPANGNACFQVFASGISVFECFTSIFKLVWIWARFRKSFNWLGFQISEISQTWISCCTPAPLGFLSGTIFSVKPVPGTFERLFINLLNEYRDQYKLYFMVTFNICCIKHWGNQPWIFIGRTDAEAEASVLWPPDAKSWLIGKDPDAGKDWQQEEKGTTEDEVVGWYHQLSGHDFMNLSKLREIVEDRGAWHAAVHGVAKSWTGLSDWKATTANKCCWLIFWSSNCCFI